MCVLSASDERCRDDNDIVTCNQGCSELQNPYPVGAWIPPFAGITRFVVGTTWLIFRSCATPAMQCRRWSVR